MNIIFVCNSKYHRATLKKILNNHGLKFKYFENTKLCVNVGFSCLIIPITPPPSPPYSTNSYNSSISAKILNLSPSDGCFNIISKSEKNMCDRSQLLEKLHFLVYIFAFGSNLRKDWRVFQIFSEHFIYPVTLLL